MSFYKAVHTVSPGRQNNIFGVSRTSSIGNGSSKLLSHFTETFDAEKKNWEAAISNKPAFLSKNADAVECHRSERPPTRSGCRSGEVSSGMDDLEASPGSRGPEEDDRLVV